MSTSAGKATVLATNKQLTIAGATGSVNFTLRPFLGTAVSDAEFVTTVVLAMDVASIKDKFVVGVWFPLKENALLTKWKHVFGSATFALWIVAFAELIE
jgi:hypothetical protein